jgi:hypothetical protein
MMPLDLGELVLKTTMCPRCEARPGEKCVTVSGKPAPFSHNPRWEPVYLAWNRGVEFGREYHQ